MRDMSSLLPGNDFSFSVCVMFAVVFFQHGHLQNKRSLLVEIPRCCTFGAHRGEVFYSAIL